MDDQGTNREGGNLLIDKIRASNRKIFFVHAKWSGSSCWAFPRFQERADRHGIPHKDITYLSADDEANLCSVPEFFGNLSGKGEVVVVRDGQVVFLTNLGQQKDQFEQRFDQMLEAYNAEK